MKTKNIHKPAMEQCTFSHVDSQTITVGLTALTFQLTAKEAVYPHSFKIANLLTLHCFVVPSITFSETQKTAFCVAALNSCLFPATFQRTVYYF